ncbi:ectonucleotide pyrophosphatase/phosphodiesterase family member 5 isoform X2 [Nilaparvata lugens]|uniref:ectonucleotide pyrophosphatase/phosphodiesterase family member 5 isoform X2 n=1 Tax=Nilaparvata lugens TaxID=108931 RepID=UPI00193E03D6|nr:ectonucleotide pyrophosphatase/phosphodiesterase family member 5 isoform X2 [Nilaparvata lugens]
MHNYCFFSILMLIFVNVSLAAVTHLQPVTIVISLDGFYYKYLERNMTPNIVKLRDEGVSAPYMINIFPTKTFPNHFSMATGQYAEDHNVLDNLVFDPILNKTVGYSEELFTKGNSTVPFWIVNEKSGKNKYSGVMMWPGGDYRYQGLLPTHQKSFDLACDFNKRIDIVIEWITNSSTPANLVFLYIEEPDSTGHKFGPDSVEVDNSLRRVDETIGYLESSLKNNKVNNYNLIIMSDHGMTPISSSKLIDLTKFLTNNTYHFDTVSPILGVTANKGFEEEVAEKLKKAASEKDSHFKFYKRDDIPDDWRYKNSFRAPPYILIADHGYAFNDAYKSIEWYAKNANRTLTPDSIFGLHGYVPEDDCMHPIFMAKGPSFKSRHVVKPFKNVDLFALFANLVDADISAYRHSGDFRRVADLLAVQPDHIISPANRPLIAPSIDVNN